MQKKNKSLAYNIENLAPLHTTDGTELEWTQDFKYFGSCIESSEKDISVRKAQAWRALNGMAKIWKSSMSRDLKMRFFIATIESILLCGCESWTLSEAQEKALNGTYTRMLRKALDIHWQSHTTNQELYGELPLVSNKIADLHLADFNSQATAIGTRNSALKDWCYGNLPMVSGAAGGPEPPSSTR